MKFKQYNILLKFTTAIEANLFSLDYIVSVWTQDDFDEIWYEIYPIQILWMALFSIL